jgi:hypothetical protein
MVAVVANLLKRRPTMIKKKILDKACIRSIDDGFAFVPHRFLTGGFLAALDPDQLLLYFFWYWQRTATVFPFTVMTKSAVCLKWGWNSMYRPVAR